jgi:hypothetical protein
VYKHKKMTVKEAFTTYVPNSLDYCQPIIQRSTPECPADWDRSPKEQERPMRATIDMAGDASKDYVLDRLGRLQWQKELTIDDKFRTPYPKNKGEAKKWLKEGFLHFTDLGGDDENEYCGWEWGPDNTKPRNEARTALHTAFQDAKDTVSVLSDEQARLKALKDFESFSVN